MLTHLGGATAADPSRRRISIWRTKRAHAAPAYRWFSWCPACRMHRCAQTWADILTAANMHIAERHPRQERNSR